jgi:hypothetical protein
MARVLSLDGGGTWALIEVKALAALFPGGEATRGREVLSRFDLVAATSGGAIVAAGLVADLTLGDILARFRDPAKRDAIFAHRLEPLRTSALLLGLGPVYDLVNPRYATRRKLAALRRLLPLGDVPLHEAVAALGLPTRVVITAYDFDRRREVLFRSDRSAPAARRAAAPSPTLAEAVHASSTAPLLFFDRPAAVQGGRYWDGAVGGDNNPALVGLVELRTYGTALGRTEPVEILTLGSGAVSLPAPGSAVSAPELAQRPQGEDVVSCLTEFATAILDEPPDAATYDCHVLLGGVLPAEGGPAVADGPVVRLSPLVQPARDGERWVLPSGFTMGEFRRLVDLQMDALRPRDVALIEKLADEWIAGRIANQPIRADAELRPAIGHGTFGEAAARVRGWFGVGAAPVVAGDSVALPAS